MDVNGGIAKTRSHFRSCKCPVLRNLAFLSAPAQVPVSVLHRRLHSQGALAASHLGSRTRLSSQGTSGGFAFGTNTKATEGSSSGSHSLQQSPQIMRRPLVFIWPTPSGQQAFAFPWICVAGPKTADATSSGFSFKAPEQIQHSTMFLHSGRQYRILHVRPHPPDFAFGQAQATATDKRHSFLV